jgi:hypothetical protein
LEGQALATGERTVSGKYKSNRFATGDAPDLMHACNRIQWEKTGSSARIWLTVG